MANEVTSKNKSRAIMTLIGCVIVLILHQGYTGQFAIHVPYMAKDLGLQASQVQLASAVGTLTAFLVSLFVAKPLIKKLTPKYTLMLASALCAAQAILHYFTHGLGMLIFASLFMGTAMSIGSVMCVSLILSEYSSVWGKSFSKIVGIASAFTGVGAAIFVIVGGHTLAAMPWQRSYLTMGIALGGGAILVNLLLIKKALPDDTNAQSAQGAAKKASAGDGLTFKEALHTPSMYLLMIGITLCTLLYTGTSKYVPTFLNTQGMDSTQYSKYSSLLMIFAAIVIFASGFLLTKFGVKIFAAITFIGASIGVAIISSYIELQSSGVLVIGLLFLALGSTAASLSSQLVPRLFGTKDYAAINPVVSGAYFIGIAISSVVLGRVAEAFGSYRAAHILSIGFGILGFICILLALRLSPYSKAKEAENKNA